MTFSLHFQIPKSRSENCMEIKGLQIEQVPAGPLTIPPSQTTQLPH